MKYVKTINHLKESLHCYFSGSIEVVSVLQFNANIHAMVDELHKFSVFSCPSEGDYPSYCVR